MVRHLSTCSVRLWQFASAPMQLSLSCAYPYYSCSLSPPFFVLTGKKRSLVGKFPGIVMCAPLTLFSLFSETAYLGYFRSSLPLRMFSALLWFIFG